MSDSHATLKYPRAALALAMQKWEKFHATRATTSALFHRFYLGAVTCNDAPDQRYNVALAWVGQDGAVRTVSGGYLINEQPQTPPGQIVFNSIQRGNKLIGVYSLLYDDGRAQRARAFLHWSLPPSAGETWVESLRVSTYPISLGDATALFFSDSCVYVAVMPLTGASDLGEMGVLHEESQGWTLSLYDRLPSEPHAQWGPQLVGYVLEVASSEEFATLNDFRRHIAQVEVEDILEGNVRTITYLRGDEGLCLAVAVGWEREARRAFLPSDEPAPVSSV
ncbi:MAG: hypothetical protein NZT92_19810 [Abditibacteriales bacterium]|nr:hypothetical protein [Abditibacteriales bacterium]MDW8367962.1 hypothetical protein [Abditibacteriales bacterium]